MGRLLTIKIAPVKKHRARLTAIAIFVLSLISETTVNLRKLALRACLQSDFCRYFLG